MIEIKLKDEDVSSKKITVEYLNWTCPHCESKQSTMEYLITNKELFCNKCYETVKYIWV